MKLRKLGGQFCNGLGCASAREPLGVAARGGTTWRASVDFAVLPTAGAGAGREGGTGRAGAGLAGAVFGVGAGMIDTAWA